MLNIKLADTPEIYGNGFFYFFVYFYFLFLSHILPLSEVLNGNPALESTPPTYEFMDPHLVDYSVRVKNMHLVDSSEGKRDIPFLGSLHNCPLPLLP